MENVLVDFINTVSGNAKNRNLAQEIIDEITEENERVTLMFHGIAESVSEAEYEYIPTEFRTPYDHEAATAFKKNSYESCFAGLCKGRLIIDLASLIASRTRNKRKSKEINVVYENKLQEGLFEKILADIYSRKVTNESFEI